MVTIGRDSKNDIALKDASVSAEHACIDAIKGNRLLIRDLGSRSGTFLWRDEQWIQAVKIQLGPQDRVRFGNYEMSWQDLAQSSAGSGMTPGNNNLRSAGLLLAGKTSDKPVFENPKRNPITGAVEERD
ncbi:MAG TPA: FHA domain-containing protein [Xanthomonadales bacterium]|nr:FHA domain-containing protein [Xanthomonadales bacterium]